MGIYFSIVMSKWKLIESGVATPTTTHDARIILLFIQFPQNFLPENALRH